MATLKNPKLAITLISGTSNAAVTASVDLKLDSVDKALIKIAGLRFKVSCSLRGADSGLNGGDDTLYTFEKHACVESGTVTFKGTISRDHLDEDMGNDEIYALFGLKTNSTTFQAHVSPKKSPEISGNF